MTTLTTCGFDETGAVDALPFMPEMQQFCGRRFRVDKVVTKLCDTMRLHARSCLTLAASPSHVAAEVRCFWRTLARSSVLAAA